MNLWPRLCSLGLRSHPPPRSQNIDHPSAPCGCSCTHMVALPASSCHWPAQLPARSLRACSKRSQKQHSGLQTQFPIRAKLYLTPKAPACNALLENDPHSKGEARQLPGDIL